MPRKTKTSSRVQKYANRALKSSKDALLADLCEGMYEAYIHNGKRLPYGHVTKLLKELKPKEGWLSRNILNKAFMKCRCEKKKLEEKRDVKTVPDSICAVGTNLSTLSELSNVSRNANTGTWNVGRPIGSTEAKKEATQNNVIMAKNEITKRFASMKDAAKKKRRESKARCVSKTNK